MPCQLERYELLDYLQAEQRQQQLVGARQSQQVEDHLLLLEHPPVLTLGRGASPEHVHDLRGRPLHRTGRGGEVTYHGPGQLVAYPILLLEEGRRDLHRYLRDLEQVVIEICTDWNLQGERVAGKTGVWVGGAKLASLGVRASRWVTSHGVALNYGPDLSGFAGITPCGLAGVEMTSLSRLLEVAVSREEVEERFCRHFQRIFGRRLRGMSGEQ